MMARNQNFHLQTDGNEIDRQIMDGDRLDIAASKMTRTSFPLIHVSQPTGVVPLLSSATDSRVG